MKTVMQGLGLGLLPRLEVLDVSKWGNGKEGVVVLAENMRKGCFPCLTTLKGDYNQVKRRRGAVVRSSSSI